MPLLTYNGRLLVVDGRLRADPSCCCGLCPAPNGITYFIDLSGTNSTVVSDVDLSPYVGGTAEPDLVLAYETVLVFESYCCDSIPNSALNNNRFVYYSFYTCGNTSEEFDSVFGQWVEATYGAGIVATPSTPQVELPATNAEVTAFIEAVRNSAASGGTDAASEEYFRDLNFGCPC